MQEREILRGDRTIGLSNYQMSHIHGPTRFYDLAVDTTNTSSFDCAREILAYSKENKNPQSFHRLREELKVM
jgi:chloramphenicol 3-O phosphotransferase